MSSCDKEREREKEKNRGAERGEGDIGEYTDIGRDRERYREKT